MSGYALKARDVTEELLHALLRLWALPATNENDCARVQGLAALARLRDAFAAEAALILQVVRVDVGHTI